MATLTSVLSDYEDNADYDESSSTAKAKAFRSACRKLLVMLPREQQTGGAGGERIAFRAEAIKEAIDDVNAWLATSGRGSVVHSSFEDYRE